MNTSKIIECGQKIYYDINPNSKMDIPSYFYELLEPIYDEWKIQKSNINFCDYCKLKLKK